MNERLSVGKDLEQLADLDTQSRSQSDGALELELAQTKVTTVAVTYCSKLFFELWFKINNLKFWARLGKRMSIG